MYEVEVKVRTALEPIRARLAELGATREGAIVQTDTYYDHPCRSFAETDEALRIRRERELPDVNAEETIEHGSEGPATAVRLTYKGPLVEQESKTRTEQETTVADGDVLAAVLEGLGFDPVARVEKRRERYRVEDYVVSLDDVASLGTFVEVETEGTRDQVESLREDVYDLCRSLDLDPETQIRTSYLELLLDG